MSRKKKYNPKEAAFQRIIDKFEPDEIEEFMQYYLAKADIDVTIKVLDESNKLDDDKFREEVMQRDLLLCDLIAKTMEQEMILEELAKKFRSMSYWEFEKRMNSDIYLHR